MSNDVASPPWESDRRVTPEEVAAVVRSETDLPARKVRWLGAGWDAQVFRVDEEWVFKFITREEGIPCAEAEGLVLPLLPPLPLEVPRLQYRGVSDGRWPWLGYQEVRGETTELAATAGPLDRRAAAEKLGRFLSRLHALPIGPFSKEGLREDWIGHMDLRKRVPFARDKMKELKEAGFSFPTSRVERVIREVEELQGEGLTHPVHGDFRAGHLIWREGEVRGVIDWGDAHLGHPACDLAVAFSFLPPTLREVFWDAYGPLRQGWLALSRFRAFFHNATVLLYARGIGKAALEAEAVRALGWALE